MKLSVTFLLLLLPLTASAARLDCSIRPRDISAASLPGLAKVSQLEARKTALAAIDAPAKAGVEGKLEVEKGCLVYTFDVKVPGQLGIEEVLIDAGTGAVLLKKHVKTLEENEGKPN